MSLTIRHHQRLLTRKQYDYKNRKTKRRTRVPLATKKRAGSIVKPKEVEPEKDGQYMITTDAKCHRVYSTDKNASYRNQFVRAYKKIDSLQSGHIVTCTDILKTPIIQISYNTKADEKVTERYINYKNKSGTICFLTDIPNIIQNAVLYMVRTSKIYSDENCTHECGSLPKNKPVQILKILQTNDDASEVIAKIAYYIFNKKRDCYLKCKTRSCYAVYEGTNKSSDLATESRNFNKTMDGKIKDGLLLVCGNAPQIAAARVRQNVANLLGVRRLQHANKNRS